MNIKKESGVTEEFNKMKQRIITAIIALAIVIPVALYGNWLFNIFAFALATIGLYELIRMKNLIQHRPVIILGFVLLWLMLLKVDTPLFSSLSITKENTIVFLIMVLLAYTVLSKNTFTFEDVSFVVFSTMYIGLGFFYLMELRVMGLDYLFFIFLIIWATDSGAYFFGRAIGKHKLWPAISPNKTVEGALGGVVSAIIIAIIFQYFQGFNYHITYIMIIAILVSISGQIGDLVASAIKRHFNVKDSGKIMPGHGGVLDRLDSMIFVLPILAIFQFIV